MSFLVVQIAPNVHPRDKRVPAGAFTGDGVLVPVSCDGFYESPQSAHGVAVFLAEKWPHLQTLVVEVVVANDPDCPFSWGGVPDLPLGNEAPPAFIDKKKERAKMSAALRYQTIKRDGYRCRACGFGVHDGAHLHVDHIVAIANGGKTQEDNLQTLCTVCNLGKGAT